MVDAVTGLSMTSSTKLSHSQTKDVYLQHISTDIKGIQEAQCDVSMHMDVLTDGSTHAQSLCEHLDCILMHGLYRYSEGYWPCVRYFTHSSTVREIRRLVKVNTDVGRGRAWLNFALNEQAMESYLRMFIENQGHLQSYYLKEAFLRDKERLSLLLTLISGLDFVNFDLPTDSEYLDHSASSLKTSRIDFNVKPNFIGSVTPEIVRRKEFTQSDTHVPTPLPVHAPPSPSSDAPLFSSLPSTLTSNTSNSIGTEKEEDKSSLHLGFSSTDGTPPVDTTTAIADGASSFSEERKEEPTVTLDHKEDVPPGDPPAKPLQLSFLDRHSQLATLEKERKDEEILVSRKKKSSKSKKKKNRRKEDEGRDGMRERTDKGLSPEPSLLDSLKENHPPANPGPASTASLPVPLPDSTRLVPPDRKSGVDDSGATRIEVSSPSDVDEVHGRDFDDRNKTSTEGSEETTPVRERESVVGRDMSLPGRKGRKDDMDHIDDVSNNPFDEFDEFNSSSSLVQEIEAIRTSGSLPWEEGPMNIVKGHSRTASNEHKFGEMHLTNEPGFDPSTEHLLSSAVSAVKQRRETTSPEKAGTYPLPEAPPDLEIHVSSTARDHQEGEEDIDGLASSHLQQEEGETDKSRKGDHGLTLDLKDDVYESPPKRPTQITKEEAHSCDDTLDDNTRIVLQLDVFHHSDETAVRVVQAHVPQGPGRYQKACIIITDLAVYLAQNDGTEGTFCHMLGVPYSQLNYVYMGLSGQSLGLVYTIVDSGGREKQQKQIVVTGKEAVTRSVVSDIRKTAAASKVPMTIPLGRDDEARVEAIEKELIKLGSETSMEVVRYCMVYWEQLSGETPLLSPPTDITIPISGTLFVKENTLFKKQSWSTGFFQLLDGTLYHFSSESDKSPKSSYPMRGLKCGGCTRASGEAKDYAFNVLDTNGSSLVLAAENEEDLTRWMQALCMAAIDEDQTLVRSPVHKGSAYCAVLLTQNKVHVLKEDWSNETVQLVTSISVQDINEIGVEKDLPIYCTLNYDDWEKDSSGMWMLCFSSEYELGQFEHALTKKYKEIFQVEPRFSEIRTASTRDRAHAAIDLMKSSRSRSDSITRGRTEFTFSH